MAKSAPRPRKARRTAPAFTPVPTRPRHDGWSPERQVAFIEALAESACVEEAAQTVGVSARSAYRLRARVDAQSFRLAWDAALDFAIRRLSDAAYARALHGMLVPHFYKGEQVGEHRRYDNRLTMFLLRYRDPLRYAATLDQLVYSGHPETAAIRFAKARDRLEATAFDDPEPLIDAGMDEAATPTWEQRPLPTPAEAWREAEAVRAVEEAEAQAVAEADFESRYEEVMAMLYPDGETPPGGDVARLS